MCFGCRHCVQLEQCFSTGVPQNLGVLPVTSKYSVESNRETETTCKRRLRPLDAFSVLLLCPTPKCICNQSSTLNPAGGALPRTPNWRRGEGFAAPPQVPLPTLRLSLQPRISALLARREPLKTNSWLRSQEFFLGGLSSGQKG